jgi:hypothetical protein
MKKSATVDDISRRMKWCLVFKLRFVWMLKVTQLWRFVQPCIACATLYLMYTKLRALDTSIIHLTGFLYNTNEGTGVSPNFIDTASSLPCSQQLTTFPSPEIEKSSSLQPISYIITIYIHFFQVVSFLQIFFPKIHMKFSYPPYLSHALKLGAYHFNYAFTELSFLVSGSCGIQTFLCLNWQKEAVDTVSAFKTHRLKKALETVPKHRAHSIASTRENNYRPWRILHR